MQAEERGKRAAIDANGEVRGSGSGAGGHGNPNEDYDPGLGDGVDVPGGPRPVDRTVDRAIDPDDGI